MGTAFRWIKFWRYRPKSKYDEVFEYSSEWEWMLAAMLTGSLFLYSIILVWRTGRVSWLWLTAAAFSSCVLCAAKFQSKYLVLNYCENEITLVRGVLFGLVFDSHVLGDLLNLRGVHFQFRQTGLSQESVQRLVLLWRDSRTKITPLTEDFTHSSHTLQAVRDRRIIVRLGKWWNRNQSKLRLPDAQFGGDMDSHLPKPQTDTRNGQKNNNNHTSKQEIELSVLSIGPTVRDSRIKRGLDFSVLSTQVGRELSVTATNDAFQEEWTIGEADIELSI